MKYAVIGAAGQLGRDLCPLLPSEVVLLGRPEADLLKPDALDALLGKLKPNVVVNCAAYNFVDKAELEPEAAFAVNCWGVRSLARTCTRLDCTLVHFSTDYVFGSQRGHATAYRPTDNPGPVSVYGMSKLGGEHAIQAECQKHLIIRTCGLYGVWGSGGKGTNFIETMLRLAERGTPIKVVNDQRCTPSYTVDVAETTLALIQNGAFGLYHVTNAGSTTWFEFAQTIFKLSGIKADVRPISSAEFGAPARRPSFSVLDNSFASDLFGLNVPRQWEGALGAYLAQRKTKDQQVGTPIP
jgi:dTDP-4-dehydrorhamnose reductase